MVAPVIVQIDPSPVALSVYAAECGVTAETLIAWSRAHQFPAYRLGKVYLVSRLDAYNWWHEKTKGEGRKRTGHTGNAAVGQSQTEETDGRPDAFRPSRPPAAKQKRHKKGSGRGMGSQVQPSNVIPVDFSGVVPAKAD